MKKYIFLIAVVTAISLTGCDVMQQGHKEKGEDIKSVKATPRTISYDEQIDLILDQKAMWCFSLSEGAAEPEEVFVTEADYYYRISDMDQNGRLEVISSTTTGNGSIFHNTYFEVSEDGKKLDKLSAATSDSGEALEPDLWDFSGYSPVYYDQKAKVYHYPQWDHTHSSAVDTEDVQEDMVLLDGEVTVDSICGQKSKAIGRKKVVTEYYAGTDKKKYGQTVYRIKKDWEAEHPQQDKKYARRLEEISQQYYKGMNEYIVTFEWFQSIDTKKYLDTNKIKMISDDALRKRVEKSWDSFGIHDMAENDIAQIDNPYFPADFTQDTEIDFQVDLMTRGKATMKIREEQIGKNGMLYMVSWHDPRKWRSREFAHVSKGTKELARERLENCSFYLWVTNRQIYYMPVWNTYDMENSYDIMRLLFYNEIPEYAKLVCQEEEIKDSLDDMEPGEHQWLEKQAGDLCCYRSYTSKGEGYDTSDILQLVWKKGIGLVGYRSAAHPAGGFSTLLWRNFYIQLDDVGFDI